MHKEHYNLGYDQVQDCAFGIRLQLGTPNFDIQLGILDIEDWEVNTVA